MANRLSDEELRQSLKEYGEDVGPITPTTRTAWERRLSTIRKSKSFTSRKPSLNAFSSDDSEIENSFTSPRRNKRTSFNSKIAKDRLNSSTSGSFSLDESTFKKPISPSFTVQRKKIILEKPNHLHNQYFVNKLKNNSTKSTPFEVETSDSDFDSEYHSHLKLSRRTRRKSSPKCPLETSTQNPQNFSGVQRNSLPSSVESSPEIQHFSSSSFKPDHAGQRYTNGYISNTLKNGDLGGKRVIEGSSTNYSHCISWLLLFGTATFFIIIGILYITELQKTSHMANKNSKFCERVEEENCENLILLSRELHHLLATTAGIYDCADNTINLKRNVTIPDARIAMDDYFTQDDGYKIDNFDALFTESVLLLTRFPEMGIKSYPTYEDTVTQSLPASKLEISALEAVHGSKTLKCRIQLSFKWTLTKVVLLCFGGFFLFLCFLITKLWKKRKEAQEKMFYNLVDKVIDTLREGTNEWPGENEIYKAVVKVRDQVISPQERKEKLWLWDRVVAFIEDHESRVSVEYRTINGEDFKVWKWQPPTNIETESGKHGKVWQGQAFTSVGKAKNTMYSLSPCLKIRNMFDSEVEYEEGWKTSIQDAILEKCEGNDGIRHIAIDNSSNEGCVYMLCSSSETAGKAFNDLHGWWFDNKLVTVKYIPYKRYLERFPESEHCTEPLRPSNNKRLSLSAPFFQSALERS